MAKKYTENHKLNMAVKILLSSLDEYETFPIHDIITLESGDGLPKHQMIDGPFPAYGGGGKTENNHYAFNIDFETIGIGRVGARCGCVFPVEKKSWVTDNALYIKEFDKRFSLKFLRHFLNYSNLNQYANIAMQPVISKTGIKSVKIPFLPFEKQTELGDFIEELEANNFKGVERFPIIKNKFAVLNGIENLEFENEIQNNSLSQLRQSILQDAIQGKLTESWRSKNKEVEPASEILKRIKAEQGKAPKKSKKTALPEIQADKKPFELPINWEWCNGADFFKPMESKLPKGEMFGYIDIASIDNKNHKLTEPRYIPVSEAPSRASRKVYAGSTLFSLVRPYLGNIAFIEDKYADCIASTGFYVCTPQQGIYPKYLYYLMISGYVVNGLNNFMKGVNSPSINTDDILCFKYPLPPLKEQYAIVEKIEKLLSKCAELKVEVEYLKTHIKTILKALFKETFEAQSELCQD